VFVVRLESYRPNSEDRAEVIERPDGLVIVVADDYQATLMHLFGL
jgi:hypothetical protein